MKRQLNRGGNPAKPERGKLIQAKSWQQPRKNKCRTVPFQLNQGPQFCKNITGVSPSKPKRLTNPRKNKCRIHGFKLNMPNNPAQEYAGYNFLNQNGRTTPQKQMQDTLSQLKVPTSPAQEYAGTARTTKTHSNPQKINAGYTDLN